MRIGMRKMLVPRGGVYAPVLFTQAVGFLVRHIKAALPFLLLGIDSDNGGESLTDNSLTVAISKNI